MAVSDGYLDYLRDLLDWVPGLRSRRMFGGVGLYGEDGMFAIAVDDGLFLKGDDDNRALFRDAGAERFGYQRQGRTMHMNYWSVSADVLEEPDQLRTWVEAALQAARRAGDK